MAIQKKTLDKYWATRKAIERGVPRRKAFMMFGMSNGHYYSVDNQVRLKDKYAHIRSVGE